MVERRPSARGEERRDAGGLGGRLDKLDPRRTGGEEHRPDLLIG